ncbi:hypothetical protein Slala04_15060 [Streptomyces lavendulae subsp. lavendulae]|nr:hypothetical protein Slala04_15060 [Streptomyces lavendulae subsp. lavendulae]
MEGAAGSAAAFVGGVGAGAEKACDVETPAARDRVMAAVTGIRARLRLLRFTLRSLAVEPAAGSERARGRTPGPAL